MNYTNIIIKGIVGMAVITAIVAGVFAAALAPVAAAEVGEPVVVRAKRVVTYADCEENTRCRLIKRVRVFTASNKRVVATHVWHEDGEVYKVRNKRGRVVRVQGVRVAAGLYEDGSGFRPNGRTVCVPSGPCADGGTPTVRENGVIDRAYQHEMSDGAWGWRCQPNQCTITIVAGFGDTA